MSEVSAVRIRLAVDGASQVTSALGGVQTGLGKLEGATKTVGQSLRTMGGAFAALGLGLTTAAFTGFIRSAIDSADAMSKMAQKTGLAVKEVAGLQLAFDQAGAGDKFQDTLGKLAKSAAEGNKAFSAMGIAVNGSTGGLKSTRELIGEVADKFSSYRDGAEKTALAQQLLGRSGAEIIPLLNAGSAALAEYDQKAAALGLTLTDETVKAAEAFNDQLDLLSKRSEGVARQLTTELLPSLVAISEELSKGALEGGVFSSVGVGLSRTIETLSVVGANLSFIFGTLARDAKLAFEFGVNLATINFSGMKPMFYTYRTETEAARKALDEFERSVLSARAVASAGDLDEPWVKRAKEGFKSRGNSAKEAAPLVEKLTKATTANKDALKAETEALKALTQALETEAAFRQIIINDELKQEKLRSDRMDSTREMLESIERETAMMGLSNIEREQAIALFALEKAGVIAGTEAYDAYAAKIREAISARGNKQSALDAVAAETAATAQAAKDATAEWQKTADSINSSLTDALMRGFEDGKGFAKNLRDTLINMFQTMILRPTISAILAPLAGGLSGAANAGGAAGGGGLSTLSSLQSAYNGISTGFSGIGATVGSVGASVQYGTAAFSQQSTMLAAQEAGMSTMAGAMGSAASLLGGAMVGFMAGKMISGGYSAIGKSGNTAVVAGTAIGAILGGPLGAAIGGALGGAFNRAFGRKAPVSTGSGIVGDFSTTGASVQGYNDQFAKGGWFRSNKSWTEYSAVSSELDMFLDQSLVAITGATRAYASLLGLNADAVNGITQRVKLSLAGLNAEQQQTAILGALGGFGDKLAEQLLGTYTTVYDEIRGRKNRIVGYSARQVWNPGEFVRGGETAGEALARLGTSLTAVNIVFDTLNTTLMASSLVGADAASKLADQFGGLDALVQASTAYYQIYYRASERAKTGTRLLTERINVLGIAMPDSINGFRALVDGLDLTTGAGRKTYAALVQLAPEFAALQTELQTLADETAVRLISAFTAKGQLAPVLSGLSGALVTTTQAAGDFAGPISTIHRLLGDASSGTLVFGDRLQEVTAELTPAQLAVAALQNQVFDLSTAASRTKVDIAGLSAALLNVDTQTFVATVTGVFELIGQRVKSTLSGIADERVAVREAAIGIIGQSIMSAAQIRARIDENSVTLPGQEGIASAQNELARADRLVGLQSSSNSTSQGRLAAALARSQDSEAQLNAARAQLAATSSTIEVYLGRGGAFGTGSKKYRYDPNPAFAAAQTNVGNQAWAASEAARELALAQTAAALSSQSLSFAQLSQAGAAQQAKQAQLDYIKALQTYSVDASRAVTQLGRLREETVRYFESQQQLASLMTGAAGALRSTVAAFRFDQLDPAAQLAGLQERYNVAYSMALSTTGEALAGYGNELNSLINPLLQKAQEAGLGGVAYSNLVNTILARAEATAGRLDAFAPQNYQAESLGLLGQIDSTLLSLEKGALTADELIVKAIDAGKDSTRDGLRAVVAALTGNTVPAFATGGLHSGGLRLVGEYGPELEATGPSRIYSAGDTASMLRGGPRSGDNAALLSELRASRAEMAAMRQEMQAMQAQIVVNTGRTARQLDRWDVLGAPVRNAEGQILATEAAAA